MWGTGTAALVRAAIDLAEFVAKYIVGYGFRRRWLSDFLDFFNRGVHINPVDKFLQVLFKKVRIQV